MYCMRVLDRNVVQGELALVTARLVQYRQHAPKQRCEEPVRSIAPEDGERGKRDDIFGQVGTLLSSPVDRVGAILGRVGAARSVGRTASHVAVAVGVVGDCFVTGGRASVER